MLQLAPQKKKSSISLTPLIDVVFILLLFFMLSSVFTRWQQLPISAPVTQSPEKPLKTAHIFLLSDAAVTLKYDDNSTQYNLSDNALYTLMSSMTGEYSFLVTPTTQSTIQDVVNAMDAINANGIKAVSLTPSVDVLSVGED